MCTNSSKHIQTSAQLSWVEAAYCCVFAKIMFTRNILQDYGHSHYTYWPYASSTRHYKRGHWSDHYPNYSSAGSKQLAVMCLPGLRSSLSYLQAVRTTEHAVTELTNTATTAELGQSSLL